MSNSSERLNDEAPSEEIPRAEEIRRAEEVSRVADSGETDLTVSAERAVARARWAEIVFIVALSIYAVLAILANRYAYFDWDLSINRAIRAVALPGFGQLMVGLSWLGSGIVPIVMVVGAAVALMAAGFRLEGLVCMIGVSLGDAINGLMKLIIGRPRPDPLLVEVMRQYDFKSFPSGHVVFFVEYFGFLFFLSYVLLKRGPLRNSVLIFLSLPILLIGVSRVYMGAHWPSDTVGAYLVGGVWLMLMIETYRRVKAKRARRHQMISIPARSAHGK